MLGGPLGEMLPCASLLLVAEGERPKTCKQEGPPPPPPKAK